MGAIARSTGVVVNWRVVPVRCANLVYGSLFAQQMYRRPFQYSDALRFGKSSKVFKRRLHFKWTSSGDHIGTGERKGCYSPRV